jgi:hypothetical protein
MWAQLEKLAIPLNSRLEVPALLRLDRTIEELIRIRLLGRSQRRK